MILAYHIVFGTYGFWLPNDPRGSWSDFVASWELFRYDQATTTTSRRSLAGNAHDQELRLAAKQALKYPPVLFSGRQALTAATGFKRASRESAYVLYALAILPEHVHAVIGRHERSILRIVGHLKGRATQRLKAEGLWPADDRPVWAEHCWKVFLNDEADVARAVAYVEENPLKEGKPAQQWSFVQPWAPRRASSAAK